MTSISLKQFMNKQNILLLWDVLLDEINIDTNNTQLITNIKTVFESNIKPFSSSANNKSPIIDLNKQFLSQVVLAVNRLFPQLKNTTKINISNENIEQPYKIEDIHSARQNNFDKQVEQKRIELENYMTKPKPVSYDFSDKLENEPKITSMDSLIAIKMSERNLELEQIQTNNNFSNSNIPESWLNAKKTSVKNDKNMLETNTNTNTNNNHRLKYIDFTNNNITLLNNDVIDLNKQVKKVSWSNENDSLIDENSSISILQKFKKTNTEIENNNTLEKKQYIEQKSISLQQLEFKPEIINTPINTPIISQNTPIIPNHEFIKQLNEINNKIENLNNMVNKLFDVLSTNNIIQLGNKNEAKNDDEAKND